MRDALLAVVRAGSLGALLLSVQNCGNCSLPFCCPRISHQPRGTVGVEISSFTSKTNTRKSQPLLEGSLGAHAKAGAKWSQPI
eukprot:1215415-Prymnesium_polylepis.1